MFWYHIGQSIQCRTSGSLLSLKIPSSLSFQNSVTMLRCRSLPLSAQSRSKRIRSLCPTSAFWSSLSFLKYPTVFLFKTDVVVAMSASVCLLKGCTPYHMSSNICGRNYEVYWALSSRKSHGYLSLQKKRRQRICLFLSVCSNEDEAYRCPEIFLIEPI